MLEAEVKRWSAMPWERLVSKLSGERNYLNYRVRGESATYQFEVILLENTADHLLVSVGVDDGSFWLACHPLSESFLVHKQLTPAPPR